MAVASAGGNTKIYVDVGKWTHATLRAQTQAGA